MADINVLLLFKCSISPWTTFSEPINGLALWSRVANSPMHAAPSSRGRGRRMRPSAPARSISVFIASDLASLIFHRHLTPISAHLSRPFFRGASGGRRVKVGKKECPRCLVRRLLRRPARSAPQCPLLRGPVQRGRIEV